MIFIETPLFTRQVLELLDDEAYAELQRELMRNPKKQAQSSRTPAAFGGYGLQPKTMARAAADE